LNNDMDIIDLHDPSRVNRSPDDVKILLDNGILFKMNLPFPKLN